MMLAPAEPAVVQRTKKRRLKGKDDDEDDDHTQIPDDGPDDVPDDVDPDDTIDQPADDDYDSIDEYLEEEDDHGRVLVYKDQQDRIRLASLNELERDPGRVRQRARVLHRNCAVVGAMHNKAPLAVLGG